MSAAEYLDLITTITPVPLKGLSKADREGIKKGRTMSRDLRMVYNYVLGTCKIDELINSPKFYIYFKLFGPCGGL